MRVRAVQLMTSGPRWATDRSKLDVQFLGGLVQLSLIIKYLVWAGSVATGYGLDCPGIESRWGRDFPHLSRPALVPTQPPVQWVPGFSRGYKAAGA
jgi:hypothetical protein